MNGCKKAAHSEGPANDWDNSLIQITVSSIKKR